jgi:hypothetical protein
MHCEGKLELSSYYTDYCLIEVVSNAGLTVSRALILLYVDVLETKIVKSFKILFLLDYMQG